MVWIIKIQYALMEKTSIQFNLFAYQQPSQDTCEIL